MFKNPLVPVCLALAIWPAASVFGQFSTFQGDSSQEAAWQAAVGGSIPLEDFEGFFGVGCCGSSSDQVRELPALGITFSTDEVGAFPGVYNDFSFAHSGVNQIANFNGGLSHAASFRILAAPGRSIRALGFWQCDPQGDQPMMAYAADGSLVGTIIGLLNDHSGHGFAGFISSVPIVRIEIPGDLGDGYNHFDDLQVVTHRCESGCPADWNCADGLDSQDFFDFLDSFFNGDADFNGFDGTDSQDYFDFLEAFFTGC